MTDELVLRMLQRINENIEGISQKLASEASSSVQIATSTRGYDVTVKAYAGSDVREAGDQAIEEYLRIRAEIERRLMGEREAA